MQPRLSVPVVVELERRKGVAIRRRNESAGWDAASTRNRNHPPDISPMKHSPIVAKYTFGSGFFLPTSAPHIICFVAQSRPLDFCGSSLCVNSAMRRRWSIRRSDMRCGMAVGTDGRGCGLSLAGMDRALCSGRCKGKRRGEIQKTGWILWPTGDYKLSCAVISWKLLDGGSFLADRRERHILA